MSQQPVHSVYRRVLAADGSWQDIFPLPTDTASLEQLLRDLFEHHWREITFGPIIEGAAWEMKAPCAPTYIGMLDGYLTIAFGTPHFHLCIGDHKGSSQRPVSEQLARHRRTSRAEMYRQLDSDKAAVSWGVRLFNGHGEQQITILLPNPWLSPNNDKVVTQPDWSRLDLWDQLRARWFGLCEQDPVDRAARRFCHG
ncbi:MAG: hypothetical protein KatS3mg105_1751 [Gemmatales bacterium]|nr:MAG: hypothetical protein KatS3mg105_1751 [Gemmatales bacterium]